MRQRHLVVIVLALLLLIPTASVTAKTVIRFQDWHMTEDVWLKCLQEAAAEYEKMNPDVEIKFEPIAHADKSNKFIMASEAGNAPDVVHCEIQDIAPYIKKGYLLNLDDLIAKEPAGFMDQWAQGPKDICMSDGSYYAMPDNAQTIVLFYNPRLFEKAGLDPNKPPTTWDEFVEYGKKLTTGKGQWGFGMIANNSASLISRFLPILWSFGGDIFNEDMTKCVLDSPESMEGFKYYVELYTKHGITPPGPNEMSAQDVRTFFAQEKVGMQFGSGWTVSIVNGINPDLNAYELLKVAPLPVGRKNVTFSQMDFWAISSTTKQKEAAWDFLKYLTSEEVQVKFFKDNGVTSARVDVGESELITGDKFASVISAQIPYGKAMPMFISMNEVNDAIIIAAQEAVTGQRTPEEALLDAKVRIDALIERYQ